MNRSHEHKVRATFTIPQTIFLRFSALIPNRKRSKIIATLMEQEIKKQELALAKACEAANKESDLKIVETEFQALENTVTEPWEKA